MKKAATETTCEIVQIFDLWKERFQSSYYNIFTELKLKNKKKLLEGLKSKFEVAQEIISEPEDTVIEIMQAKDQRENRIKKKEQSLREMCGTSLSLPIYV